MTMCLQLYVDPSLRCGMAGGRPRLFNEQQDPGRLSGIRNWHFQISRCKTTRFTIYRFKVGYESAVAPRSTYGIVGRRGPILSELQPHHISRFLGCNAVRSIVSCYEEHVSVRRISESPAFLGDGHRCGAFITASGIRCTAIPSKHPQLHFLLCLCSHAVRESNGK
jgi:hypothetical protein